MSPFFSIVAITFVAYGFGRELASVTMPRKGKSDARGVTGVNERPRFSSRNATPIKDVAAFPRASARGLYSGDSLIAHSAKNFAAEPTFNQRQV